MNILIITYGSRGDVQPYVALGYGLQRVGYSVTVATSIRFKSFIENHNLNYAYMNDDLLSIIDTDSGKQLLENGNNLFQMIKHGFKVAKYIKPAQRALLKESWQAAQKSRPDLILFHPKGAAAPHIAEKLNIKSILITPIPMFIETKEWPFLIFPNLKLGQWYNLTSYRLIRLIINKIWGKYIRDFRHNLDLPPIKNFNFLKTYNNQDIPIFHAYSKFVLPRPNDWPNCAYVTGYLFLDHKNQWTPPKDLQDFLNAGPAPVYIGFGSMTGRNPKHLTNIVIDALQKANLRGIIATGWGSLSATDLPKNIFKIDNAPHDWLFPKVAAVVHHGGAGTTAAGLRAGKPSIIIPFFGDQPFWAKRINKLGLGPKPLSKKKLNSDSLAKALIEATTNQEIISSAKKISYKIQNENSIEKTIMLIEKYLNNKPQFEV